MLMQHAQSQKGTKRKRGVEWRVERVTLAPLNRCTKESALRGVVKKRVSKRSKFYRKLMRAQMHTYKYINSLAKDGKIV